jgi:hypothetical protein
MMRVLIPLWLDHGVCLLQVGVVENGQQNQRGVAMTEMFPTSIIYSKQFA